MSSDAKYWMGIWTLVAAVAISGLLSLTIFSHNRGLQVQKAIAEGGDPVLVGCAYGQVQHDICMMRAANKKPE